MVQIFLIYLKVCVEKEITPPPHVTNSLEPRWQTASLPQARRSSFSFTSTLVCSSHHYFDFLSLICAVTSDDHSEAHSKEFLQN